ncbi:MAG: hypothetical protein K2H19_09785 [Ruminococcus sp.]|nr:hypothetical protein [Ruminococcus sp.]
MIFIYIILILVIYYLVDRKKRKRQNASSESEKLKKEGCLTVLSKFVVAVFVIYMGFIIFMADMFIMNYWVFFGKKRTAEIESRYGIIVDNDIRLKNYRAIAHMEGTYRILELESNIDGMNFIKKNCQGEFLSYDKDKTADIYFYEYQGKNYQMTFYNEGDSYRVKIY